MVCSAVLALLRCHNFLQDFVLRFVSARLGRQCVKGLTAVGCAAMRHFRTALAGLPLDGEVTAHVDTLLHISAAYRYSALSNPLAFLPVCIPCSSAPRNFKIVPTTFH